MADGPKIVPAPMLPQQASPFTPAEPRRETWRDRMAAMGPSGRGIVAMREAKRAQGQNRQTQIKQMLLQAVQADPSIDLAKIAPGDTEMSSWQFATEVQKSLRKQQKGAGAAGAMSRVPELLASGENAAAQQIIERSANLMRDPSKPFQISPQMQDMSRQVALGQPLAGVDMRQAQGQAKLDQFKALPDDLKVIEASGLSAIDKAEARRAVVKRKTLGTRTSFERILDEETKAGNITPEQRSAYNQAFLLSQSAGAAGLKITLPDGTVFEQGGSGAQSMKSAEQKAIAGIESTRLVRGSIQSMISLLQEQPLASGFGSRIVGGAQSALGLSQSMQDMFNSSVGYDLMRQGQQVLQREIMAGNEQFKDERFANILAAGPEAAEVETRHLLLALGIAGATRTGTGRLSVKVVDQWLKDLNPKTAKGRDVVIRKLRTVDKELGRKEASAVRIAKSAGYEVLPVEAPRAAPGGPIQVNPNAPAPSVPGGFILYETDKKGNYRRVP